MDLLKNKFVPIAIDNVQNLNLSKAEEEWFKGRFPACTHGMYAFRADGEILGRGSGYQAERVKKMLRKALVRFETEPAPERVAPLPDKGTGTLRPIPDGGLALYVTWKVLGGYDRPESSSTSGNGKYDKDFQHSVGTDRLWTLKEEAEALGRGEFPKSLKRRLAKFYLSYAFSGKVNEIELTLKDGRITGTCRTDTGTRANLLGFVEVKGGKVTRFDLLAKGWGEKVSDCGFSAGLLVVPTGKKVPVAMLFSLADPASGSGRVPPHRIKSHDYFARK